MDGEAGWWTTSGNIGLPPLARAMGVGRQQQIGKTACKQMVGNLEKPLDFDINQEHLTYYVGINRGGLIFLFNFLFNIYCIVFNLCVSGRLEATFSY